MMERQDHLFLVYFFYGLSFLVLGVLLIAQNVQRSHHPDAVASAEKGAPHSPLLENLWFLGMFAVLHGLNEWVDMSLMSDSWIRIEGVMELVSSLLYAMSTLCLFEFGISILTVERPAIQWLRWLPLLTFLFWLGSMSVAAAAQWTLPILDARGWIRYGLGLTGGLLTGLALFTQRAQLVGDGEDGPGKPRQSGIWGHTALAPRLRKLLFVAAIFFAINAFLSTVLAAEAQVTTLGPDGAHGPLHMLFGRMGVTSPLTLFRALCAVVISFSLVQALLAIDREQNRKIQTHQRDLEKANESLRLSYERLQETQRQLVQSERMSAVGVLVSGIAHEFNNLLAGVKGYTQLARASDDVAQIHTDLDAIEETADRSITMMRNLITWVRPERRPTGSVDVSDLVRQAVELVRATHRDRLVRIDTVLQSLPHVPVAKRDMQDVVMHLVMNAMQAIPTDREGIIRVETRRLPDSRIELSVSDDGTGIATDVLDKIFLPFFTTKGAQGKSSTPGVGLGLTIAYGVVTGAGGDIQVDTEVGRGTRMVITLPTLPWSSGEAAALENPETETDALLTSMRVLVVEDERALREVMLGKLHLSAREARGVASGREAMEEMAAASFDLVFLDMLMPGISGLETMRRIQEMAPRVPVYIMTKTPDETTRGDMLERGAAGLVHAPFDAAELAEAVRKTARRMAASPTT